MADELYGDEIYTLTDEDGKENQFESAAELRLSFSLLKQKVDLRITQHQKQDEIPDGRQHKWDH